ncbi:hypothetical protein AC1031_005710 [Aphanomyces cochlioides]|nr:hypothetical protein AC1031_005710 [Aphanomyces cochlioides]
MKQVNDVIDKYALQQDLKVKGSLKDVSQSCRLRIDPPGLSNLVRFEIKEPIDSMTAFAKLLNNKSGWKKKRSPPMGWTNGDVKRRKNSPVKVHFEKPTMRGWGTEHGFVGEGSERAKVKADNLFRFNQEQKQRAEEYRRVLENTQQNQAMSRGTSPAREMKQETKSGAPGYDQQGQRVIQRRRVNCPSRGSRVSMQWRTKALLVCPWLAQSRERSLDEKY